MLFEYDYVARYEDRSEECAFCTRPLQMWRDREDLRPRLEQTSEHLSLSAGQCEGCGWWMVSRHWSRNWHFSFRTLRDVEEWRGCGVLKKLDPADLTVPLQETRDYLAAQFPKRGDLSPRRMEEIVESILKDFGLRTLLTPGSGDDGIDILLYGPEDKIVGVQVKRQKDRVTAEQIRAFTGALVLSGHVAGVFVTTSGYYPGARRTATRAWERGIPVHLVDAESLYSALQIAQRAVPRDTKQLKRLAKRIGRNQDLLINEVWS